MNSEDAIKTYKAVVRQMEGYTSMPPVPNPPWDSYAPDSFRQLSSEFMDSTLLNNGG